MTERNVRVHMEGPAEAAARYEQAVLPSGIDARSELRNDLDA